ncbi:hypothetical protein RZS08_37730, partial [Arthrospira platensis SPKY1]|nr:hypothetical protein [Arthrospira platensis SPKY1]
DQSVDGLVQVSVVQTHLLELRPIGAHLRQRLDPLAEAAGMRRRLARQRRAVGHVRSELAHQGAVLDLRVDQRNELPIHRRPPAPRRRW